MQEKCVLVSFVLPATRRRVLSAAAAYYASVGGATRHTVVVLCVCVCVCVILSVAGIAHRTLKTKR